ncbi:MAG: BatA domain-containing protein, partial [Planctomycetaceae bacterium]
MSLLMPLFLAGLATLALPVLLHLVRRTPTGRFDFSSLMFLDPVPPRLTRRSRLEHWLLLALRLGALALLTLAFARPFLREAAPLALGNLPARRVALLLDTSASLQRPGLWDHLLAASRRELDQLGPQDRVGLYTFGDTLQTVVEVDAELTLAEQRAAVASALGGLRPGWQGTDLGLALVGVADRLVAGAEGQAVESAGVIVLVSDLARGARLEALDRAPWPQGVSVVLRTPAEPPRGNAQLQLLANPPGDDSPDWRVRVTNSPESTTSEWQLGWQARGVPADASPPRQTTVTVPPGESRVIRIDPGPQPTGMAQVTLQNDPVAFDNEWYLAPPPRRTATILHDGREEDRGVAGLPYYLRLAGAAEEHREVLIEPYSPARLAATDLSAVSLVVLTGDEGAEGDPRDDSALLAWIAQGGTAWVAASGAEPSPWLASLFPELIAHTGLREPASGFALLADLDFQHPWLAPFATPPHGDFSGIHFWKACHWEVRPAAPLAPVASVAPEAAGESRPTPAPGET